MNPVSQYNELTVLPERYDCSMEICISISCSARGIQITGVTTTTIQRSDEKIKPTLEKHVFVPNETTVNLQESIRINMQIVLENFEENNIKVLEVTDKEEVHDLKALPGLIVEALSNEPVVKSHVTVEMISPSKRSEGMVVIASRPSVRKP